MLSYVELMGEHREAPIPNPWGEERGSLCTGDSVPRTAKAANAAAGIKSRDSPGLGGRESTRGCFKMCLLSLWRL